MPKKTRSREDGATLRGAAAAVLAALAVMLPALAMPLPGAGRRASSAAAGSARSAATLHRAAGAARTEPGRPAGPGPDCQMAGSAQCLLPFPSDWWTRPDPSSATGRRISFPAAAMPRDAAGVPIDPREWNRRDGFSPGQTILVHVPGLDTPAALDANHLPRVTDMGAYSQPDQRVVVIDAATGKRWPVWVEVDVTAGSPAKTLLMIHPSVNFREATRYIVALRDLRDAAGRTIPPPSAFVPYRDGTATAADPRTAHFDELFAELHRAGVSRRSLYATWDFTVASAADTSGRLLSMRDRAFASLGDTNLADGRVQGRSPRFTVASVTDRSPAEDPDIARQVVLDVQVPCFIWPACTLEPAPLRTPPGSLKPLLAALDPLTSALPQLGFDISKGLPDLGFGRFLLGRNGQPVQNPVPYEARVVCNIPRAAIAGAGRQRARVSLYGHGLLGTPYEIDAANVRTMSQNHDIVFCATDWFGMAAGDIPNALLTLLNLSHFPSLVDRVQQGLLNAMFAGRAMIAPGGLATAPAFQVNGRPIIDTSALYYDGNSQGGIYGGTLTAVEPDVRRAVLGVNGMDFSVLLYRSSDFVAKPGSFGLETPALLAYPDPVNRLLGIGLIQMLWDRADPNGYAAHLTSRPLPNTPPHTVLMQVAFGDHQVANVTAETEARTAGLPVVWPALVPGRSIDVVPYWGLRRATRFPLHGSALVMFDTGPIRRAADGALEGTGPPPPSDVPPAEGVDPHEAPRATACGQQQKSDFLQAAGAVTAPCGGPPYFAGGWDGR